jgi:hypothetical protein
LHHIIIITCKCLCYTSEIESVLVRLGKFACLAFPTPIRNGINLQTSDKLKITMKKTKDLHRESKQT